MPIYVKFLDRDLIRLVGSVRATINDSHARKYIAAGKAIEIKNTKDEDKRDESKREKGLDRPSEDKTVWNPPEKKAFAAYPKNITCPFPGPNDTLFPQI